MINAIVTHPLFGRGQVLQLRNSAREAVVRFDNGVKTVVATNMLKVLEALQPITSASPSPTMPVAINKSLNKTSFPAVTQPINIESRRTIEALRFGIVPHQKIRELSVGLSAEFDSLQKAFASITQHGGDVRVVVGEYGTGKSHFFEVVTKEALERNFLVAKISLDVNEVPPNRPQRIYNALIKSLVYPDSPDVGTLVPLLDKILDDQVLYSSLSEKLIGTIFGSVLYNYSTLRHKPGEALDALLDWIYGEKVYIKDVRAYLIAKNKNFPVPTLPASATSADQYCYLLNGWSWLANKAGYAGLAILIDESEHYSLLNQVGQERADNFFRALVYTTMAGSPHCQIQEEHLQHQKREHAFRFADRGETLFMFAVTPTVGSFSYKSWLDKEQIITLNGYLSESAINELMSKLKTLHQEAYGYSKDDKTDEVTKTLLSCLERRLINLRQTIRLAVDVYDRWFVYEDFAFSQAATEINHSLLGR